MSDWYYAENNEQKGPVSESELKTLLSGKKLPAATLIWKEGMENWTPASQVPVFAPGAPASLAGVTLGTPTTVAQVPGANNPDSTTPVTLSSLMTGGEALEVTPEDAEANKIFGIIAYLFILCLVPLFATKNSPFARYHANQGLVLFLTEIALYIVLAIIDAALMAVHLYFLPVFFSIAWLGVIALLIIGIINAAGGKCVPLPVIGKFKLLK